MNRHRTKRRPLLVGCLLGLLIAVSPTSPSFALGRSSNDWSQYHFSADHRGVNPFETILSTSTVGGLHELWTAPTGGPIYMSSVAVVQGVAYIGSGDHKLYAFDAATGAQLWSTDLGDIIQSSPAIADGIVYVMSDDGVLHALDAGTGDPVWTLDNGGGLSPPTLAHGMLFVPGEASLTAYDPSSGSLLWSAPLTSSPSGAATVKGRAVYVGATNKMYAFDAVTGAPLWSKGVNEAAFGTSTPAVANGMVFAGGSANETVYAFVARTGRLAWTSVQPGTFDSSPAVFGGKVYFGDHGNNKLWAFDAATGAVVWRVPGGGSQGGVTEANGVVYSPSWDGSVYAYDAVTGANLWTSPDTGDLVESSPTVINGTLYFGGLDGNLHAFGL